MRQRFSPSDLVLPADSFSNSYVLCQTLAALVSHSSLAINSVAGPGVDLALATRSISPTVVIASPETLLTLHRSEIARLTGLQKFAHSTQISALAAGRMPSSTFASRLFGARNSVDASGKLRLVVVSTRANTDAPALSGIMLSDLRVFLGARICYALAAANVAGAVAQTNIYDYRAGRDHFGVPVSSVEVKLANKDDGQLAGSMPSGEVVVSGPSVVGGQARIGVKGVFGEDCTLAYA